MNNPTRLRIANALLIAAVVLLVIQVAGMVQTPRPEWSRGSVIPAVMLMILSSAIRRRANRVP